MVASLFSGGSEPTDSSTDSDHAPTNGARRPAAGTSVGAAKRKLAEKMAGVGRLVGTVKTGTPRRANRKPGLLAGLDDEAVRRALAFDEPVTSGGRTDLIPDRP